MFRLNNCFYSREFKYDVYNLYPPYDNENDIYQDDSAQSITTRMNVSYITPNDKTVIRIVIWKNVPYNETYPEEGVIYLRKRNEVNLTKNQRYTKHIPSPASKTEFDLIITKNNDADFEIIRPHIDNIIEVFQLQNTIRKINKEIIDSFIVKRNQRKKKVRQTNESLVNNYVLSNIPQFMKSIKEKMMENPGFEIPKVPIIMNQTIEILSLGLIQLLILDKLSKSLKGECPHIFIK